MEWMTIIIGIVQSIMENCPQQRRDRESLRAMLTEPTFLQRAMLRREAVRQMMEQIDKLQAEVSAPASALDLEYILDQLATD